MQQFDKHFFSLLYQIKPTHSVSPVLPLVHRLSHPIELARPQCWELSNLKVTLQRYKPQGCQKKLSLSYTCRSPTLDKSNRSDVPFKCRVYPFWRQELSKQNISKICFVFFITSVVQMSYNSRDCLFTDDVTPSKSTFECQLQSRVSKLRSPFT